MTTMRDEFVATATRLLDDDPATAIVLADIGVGRFQDVGAIQRHPLRVVNVGIREALAVGAAAGLALEGFVPIIHSYAPFLVERAFEQIKLDLVHQQLPGILVSIGASYDASTEGRTHQAPADVAILSTLEGVRIDLPGHAEEVGPSLRAARRHPGVSYVRLSSATNPRPYEPGTHVVRSGRRATVLTIGPLLGPVLAAAAALDIQVVYTRTARPLPERLSEAVVPDAPLAVVEPVLEGTSMAEVVERVGSGRELLSIGVQRRELRRYGTPQQHAAAHGLDAAGLYARLRAWLDSVAPRSSPVA